MPPQKVAKSAAEILLGFFLFYAHKYDPQINAVDISQSVHQEDLSSVQLNMDSLFQGKSIIDR